MSCMKGQMACIAFSTLDDIYILMNEWMNEWYLSQSKQWKKQNWMNNWNA